jgi:hypothetical protein
MVFAGEGCDVKILTAVLLERDAAQGHEGEARRRMRAEVRPAPRSATHLSSLFDRCRCDQIRDARTINGRRRDRVRHARRPGREFRRPGTGWCAYSHNRRRGEERGEKSRSHWR